MEGGERGDIDEETLDIVVRGDERIAEAREGVGAVGGGGLLHEVVEELLDEGFVGVGVGEGEIGDVAGAGEADGLREFVGAVVARGVDGAALVRGAEAADGVGTLGIMADDTNITYRIGDNYGIAIANHIGGSANTYIYITPSKWRLVLKAYAR